MTYELRMMTGDGGLWQLQFRTRQPVVDASGAFCGFGEWSEWSDVPTVRGGEFIDQEPEHIADASKKAEPQPAGELACPGCRMHKPCCDCPEGMYDKKLKPAGEMREWWGVVNHKGVLSCCGDKKAAEFVATDRGMKVIRVIEAPSEAEIEAAVEAGLSAWFGPARAEISDTIHTAIRKLLGGGE